MNILAQTTQPTDVVMPKWFFAATATITAMIALTPLVIMLWSRLFGLLSQMKKDLASLKTNQQTTAKLAVNVAENQTATSASPNPDPALLEATKQTIESPTSPSTQPMQVKT